MKTVSLVGASGFIGHSVYRFLKLMTDDKLLISGTYFSQKIFSDFSFLDITNNNAVEKYLIGTKIDFLILLAGSKDVRRCENDFHYCDIVNRKPVENIVKIIETNKLTTRLIYFSSDYVFDGEKGFYKDTDKPNPRTNYGKSKLSAENILLNSKIDYKIIRTSAVMGKDGVFFKWILKELYSNNKINLFDNVFFTPTPIEFLNEVLLKLLLDFNNCKGKTIHLVGDERFSRYEFGLLLAKTFGLSEENIFPETLDFSGSIFQKDLSMIQSDFVKPNQKKSFFEYIKTEKVYD